MHKKETLKNGIRLVTSKVSGVSTVTVLVFVGVGSEYETKTMSGISHFLEHMMFKGTKKRKNFLAISEELDSIGAEHNAFTSNEYTGFYVKADFTHLDLALDILSDTLVNSKFERRDIEKERGVVVEEINMYKDDVQKTVWYNLYKVLYGDQPAGRKISGTKNNVRSFERKDILNHFKTYYNSENMVVSVAGNFREEEIKKKVENFFKTVKREKLLKKPVIKERQTSPRLALEFRKTDQTHIAIALRSFVSTFDEKRFTFSLLASILGGNSSSRLFVSVREKMGAAYYVWSGVDTGLDTGYLYIGAGVDNKKVDLAIKSILKELKKVKEKGVTEAELKKAKDYYKGMMLMKLETSEDVATFFGKQEILKGEINSEKELVKKIESVKLEDVNKAAKEVFQDKNLNLALIGPFKNKEKFEKILKI